MIKRFRTFIKTEKVIFKSLSDCLIQEKILSISSFKDTFDNILERYYFDLSYDNNYLLQYVLKNKQFQYLDTFWAEKKVRNKLKEKNPYLYDYCNSHYELKDGILNGDLTKINKLIKRAKYNSIITEKLANEEYIYMAINNRQHKIVEFLLQQEQFKTEFSWNLIETPLLNQDFDTLQSVLNSNIVDFRFCCENIINYLSKINKLKYYYAFKNNVKFQNRLEEMKSFEMQDYNSFMNGLKNTMAQNIKAF